MIWLKPGEGGTRLEGLGFYEKEHVFRRLPLNPERKFPDDVEKLAWNTVGAQLRFRGTFTNLQFRAVINEPTSFSHMTQIGEGGFDCYIRTGSDNDPVFRASMYFPSKDATELGSTFVSEKTDGEVTINFPLYRGVKSFEIGLDDDAEIFAPAPHKGGRILVYGGSIDQGCAASRPGMAYTNILSRWMDSEFINLGFSGAGRAEDEVALAVREVSDVSMFVINTAGNCWSRAYLAEHYPRFVALIREKYPETPMLVYSLPKWTVDRFGHDQEISNEAKAEELEKLYLEQAKHDRHVYFMRSSGGGEPFDGHPMLYEITCDGFHPNDLGMTLIAKELYYKLNEIKRAEGI